MGVLPVFLLILISAPIIRAGDGCREMIRLDFSGSRNLEVPTNTSPFPREVGNACNPDRARLVCSDAAYPKDAYCDVGSLKIHSSWVNNSHIDGMELSYSAKGVWCKVSMSVGESGDLLLMEGRCFGDTEHETLPPFRISELLSVKITTTESLDTTQGAGDKNRCVNRAYNFGASMVLVPINGSGQQGAVAFNFKNSDCIGPYSTIFGGRRKSVSYTQDGRRYRPSRD